MVAIDNFDWSVWAHNILKCVHYVQSRGEWCQHIPS